MNKTSSSFIFARQFLQGVCAMQFPQDVCARQFVQGNLCKVFYTRQFMQCNICKAICTRLKEFVQGSKLCARHFLQGLKSLCKVNVKVNIFL